MPWKQDLKFSKNITCPVTCLSLFIWDYSLRLLQDRIENQLWMTSLMSTNFWRWTYPICVMLHGLEVRVLRISDIPNSDDGISTRSVKPVQVGIVLKRVHPGPVTSLTFLSDDKRHLNKNNGALYPQSYFNNIETPCNLKIFLWSHSKLLDASDNYCL